ncbi:MAG: hypothetical protein FD177_495 [Desulfovibrionaceae bacterium]|nr:MAG: hypothetical protein FD177_495 [Desulfovibrionaceae bacterium]
MNTCYFSDRVIHGVTLQRRAHALTSDDPGDSLILVRGRPGNAAQIGTFVRQAISPPL